MESPENTAWRLKVEAVSKTYITGVWPFLKRNRVLSGVSMEVLAGEKVALVGANGSGKSTLMMIIAGILARDTGKVKIGGRIGYCPQYPILYEKLTINETFRLFGVAYGMTPEKIEERQMALFSELDFARYRHYRVEHLSGGTKQKLNLALALLHDPELLLLDEPYSGFDYETYLRFWQLSDDIAKRGHSILVISHFIQERQRFDRIYKIKDGKSELER